MSQLHPFRTVPAVPPTGVLRVVAPSGVIDAERTAAGIALLEQLGFNVDFSNTLLQRCDPDRPYLAGDDRCRARELENAFADPKVHGVVCARGGYGATRLLEHLDPEVFRANPKPLIGFSDITALCGFLARTAGIASWHGPVVQSLSKLVPHEGASQHPVDAFYTALTGQWTTQSVDGLDVLRSGDAKGVLVGGNLSLLHALVGTPWFPTLDGAIVFVEEVGEAAYRIDRMLVSMHQRGDLNGVRAVVLGNMGGGVRDRYVTSEQFDPLVKKLVLDVTEALGVPVVAGLPVGHDLHNIPLPFGTKASLKDGRLVLASAVHGGPALIA